MGAQTLNESNLRTLVEVSPNCVVCAIGAPGGYSLMFTIGELQRTLANSRGVVRLFSLESAANFLSAMGVHRFEIDTSSFRPGRLRKPRPDRAAAMRNTRTRPLQDSLL